ncbi:sodium/proton antiporter (CPA1 family) [Amnibacterium kyonggiense]|uniref:Sodium/proton antiporter (CPA1 family) n=2 Tax=Amnibacterium kyonggiense TaxID=595671 RepID=A0A4V3EB11_9MICO|nr:sodium/proton antiporter (CPA1 family) [Amnibacterium kyonggiense]
MSMPLPVSFAGMEHAAEIDFGVIEVVGVIGIAVIVLVAAFSRRLGIAAPILLVVIGVGLSYAPGVPELEVPPEFVLDVLLPPILYAAAIRLSFVDFRRNLGTIVSLSVVLVAVTAFGTGFVLFDQLDRLDLAAGIALGAVLSPPDAVAATAVGRRLGLPPRLLVVLEGEGLVNDATALVLFGSAIALVGAKTDVNVLLTAEQFGFAVVVAVAIGLLVGVVRVAVRSRLDDSVLATAISITVPFLAFAPTNALGASGVLAVVVAGLYTGYANPGSVSVLTRTSDRINWSTIQFLLENAVFLLIGLQIRGLIEDVDKDSSQLSLEATIALGLLATVILIALRFLWVGPLVLLLKLREQHAEVRTLRALQYLEARLREPTTGLRRKRITALRRRYARQRADLEQLRSQTIDWRGGVVLGWSGMRGVVTLAAAQSLPQDLPYRSQLVLIAFIVAVVTLLLQGGTLPALIRALRISGIDEEEDQRQLAALLDELSFTGLAVLDDPEGVVDSTTDVDPEVIERVRQASYLRAEAAWERSHSGDLPLEATPHRLFRRLRLAVVEAEREHLLELRRQGVYPARIEDRAQALLDLEEARLRPARTDH